METKKGKRLLSLAWKEAVADLLIDVATPYTLLWEGRYYLYPVLIKNFGNTKGTLLVLYGDKREKEIVEIGEKAGFFMSIEFNTYIRYERNHFIDTLNDLGWFGPKENMPNWFTGAPWT